MTFSARAYLIIFGTLYGFVAVTLVSERDRYLSDGGVAFGLLFILLDPAWWACIWALVAATYAAATVRWPKLAPWALIAGAMVSAGWAAGFALRYLEHTGTPPNSAVSWTLLAYANLHELLRLNQLLAHPPAPHCCIAAPNGNDTRPLPNLTQAKDHDR
jgi:hypothetical protein